MLKIFSEAERKQMGIIRNYEAKQMFPNKAFIMINTKDIYKIIDGKNCQCGFEGILYAIADLEDKDEYAKTVNDLYDDDNVEDIATFTSFKIKDGIHYVRG